MSTEFWRWLGEAITQFVNGCFGGLGSGAGAGTGVAVTASAQANWDLNSDITFRSILIAVVALAGNGLRRFIIWHHTHEMPNPFVRNPFISEEPPMVSTENR